MPCIVDEKFKLAESIAILRYLDAKYNIADDLYPREPQKRARVDEYLEWQHVEFRAKIANHFRLRFIRPLMYGKPTETQLLQKAAKIRDEALDKIEQRWLNQSKFIAGDKLTVADLFAACEIEQSSELC